MLILSPNRGDSIMTQSKTGVIQHSIHPLIFVSAML